MLRPQERRVRRRTGPDHDRTSPRSNSAGVSNGTNRRPNGLGSTARRS
ncbi:hypothetical protein ACFPM0_33140 [Pseudonocardia sulfidoxydans]